MTEVRIGVLVIVLAIAYLAAASRFCGTRLCPKWWQRFILSQSNH